jgi:hypothetical protein
VDKIMERLVNILEIEQPPYSCDGDPTKKTASKMLSWDFAKSVMSNTKRMYLDRCTKVGKRSSQGKVGENDVKVPKVDPSEKKSDNNCAPVKEELIVKVEPDQEMTAKTDAINSEMNSTNKI